VEWTSPIPPYIDYSETYWIGGVIGLTESLVYWIGLMEFLA